MQTIPEGLMTSEFYGPGGLELHTYPGSNMQFLKTALHAKPTLLNLPTGNLIFQNRGIVFIAHGFRPHIPKRYNPVDAISTTNLNKDSFQEPFIGYMGLALEALIDNVKLVHGQCGIDLGCGNGPLSLASVRLGAKRMEAVDIGLESLIEFADNIEVNERIPGSLHDTGKYNLIHWDIRHLSPSCLKDPNSIRFAIANIGPHEPYGNTHLSVVPFLRNLPNLRLIILGGYFEQDNKKPGFEEVAVQLESNNFSYSYKIWPPRDYRTPDNLSHIVIVAKKK